MRLPSGIRFGTLFGAVGLCVVLLLALTVSLAPQNNRDDFQLPTLAVLPSLTPQAAQSAALAASTDIPAADSTAAPIQAALQPILPEISSEPLVIPALPEPMANQMIIQFAENASVEEREAYLDQVGGTVIEDIAALNTVVITVPDNALTLPPSSVVEVSEPDYYVTALLTAPTSDVHYAEQWALPAIGAPEAWLELPADAPAITVAVIDSGVCADHPDLAGHVLAGWDYVDGDNLPQDGFAHGCGVAGIIAAQIDNGEGMAGIAPNARILPFRVLNNSGIGLYSDVAAAIVRATDEGAQIINLSLGGSYPSSVLEAAIAYATAQGVIVVAAAGNSSAETVLYPAAYNGVIAVGAVDPNLERSSFSNYGAGVDVWAPGRGILTTRSGNSYAQVSGTSYAAPHVSGVAALELALGSDLALGGLLATSASNAQPQPEPEATSEATEPEATPEAEATVDPIPTEEPVDRNEPPVLFLVSASDTDAQAAQSVIGALGVVRSRAVEVNFAVLPDSAAESLAQQPASGALTLNLFEGVTLTAIPDHLEPRISGEAGVMWIGSISGDEYSEVVLIVGDGYVEGHIRYDGKLYQVTSMGDGVHVVNQISENEFFANAHDDFVTVELPEGTEPTVPDASAADTASFIDVMVLYTADAMVGQGGTSAMVAAIEASVQATNQSYQNSSVNQRIRLAHIAQVSYTETNDIYSDLTNLQDGSIANTHALRDTYHADLVTLITENDFFGICGLGFMMPIPTTLFEDRAYSVVRRECMPGGTTVAHELGHNMGQAHDLDNGGGRGVSLYSNGFQDVQGAFATIMAYNFNGPCDQGCERINYWSNNIYTHLGRRMGDAALADNRRSLNETALVVANFRTTSVACFSLETDVSPIGAGTVQVLPTPNCEGNKYTDGTVVTVTAIPNQGYVFNEWRDLNNDTTIINPFDWPVTGNYSFTANFTTTPPALTNDDFDDAYVVDLADLPYSNAQNTTTATNAFDDPTPQNCGPIAVGNSVWYTFVGDGNTVTLDTFGSDFDTVIAVFAGDRSDLSNPNSEVDCNDEAASTHQSELSFTTGIDAVYNVMISGYFGDSGNLVFSVSSPQCDYVVTGGNPATLISAINGANATSATPDTICITGPFSYTFSTINNGLNALPVITSEIKILGVDPSGLLRSNAGGVPEFRFFTIAANGNLTIQNVLMQHGWVADINAAAGGAIVNNGTLRLIESDMVDNHAKQGGAIANFGTLDIVGGLYQGNGVPNDGGLEIGGAIYNNGPLTVEGTIFREGSADSGGAIYNSAPYPLTISSATFEENVFRTGAQGVNIYNAASGGTGGTVIITDTLFITGSIFNGANGGGGGTMSIVDSVIHSGFGITNQYNLHIENVVMYNNTATLGGAVNNSSTGTVTIIDTGMYNNLGNDAGGAIYNAGTMTLDNVEVRDNRAGVNHTRTTMPNANAEGGAVWNSGTFTAINNTNFFYNWASRQGGALWNSGTMNITDALIENNRVTSRDGHSSEHLGGAIYTEGGTLTVNDSLLLNNGLFYQNTETAIGDGGAIAKRVTGAVNIHGSCIIGNRASSSSGVNGISNTVNTTINATNNWWGVANGPGGAGGGLGDSITTMVTYQPYLTSPILGCITTATVAPIETNLVTNGDFSNALNSWQVGTNVNASVTNGQMLFNHQSAQGQPGSVYQILTTGSLYQVTTTMPFEVLVDIGNTTGSNKTVYVNVNNPNNPAQGVTCTFTVLANTVPQTFTMRFKPPQNWVGMRLDLSTPLDAVPSTVFDNVSVKYRPSLNVSATECLSPNTPPPNSNLLLNGDFANGEANWNFFGGPIHNATAGFLNLTRVSGGSVPAVAYQGTTLGTPQNSVFELKLDLGNSSSFTRQAVVILRNPDFTDSLLCTFYLPANTDRRVFALRGRTSVAWATLTVQLHSEPGDDMPALQIDNVDLRYRPDLNPTGTECITPPVQAGLNLVTNNDFHFGENEWAFYGDITHSVTGANTLEVMNLTRNSNAANLAAMFQNLHYAPANGDVIEARLQMGNTSSQPKTIWLFVRNDDWSELMFCTFTVPGNTPLGGLYRLRSRTDAAWTASHIQIHVDPADGAAGLQLDNLNVQYRPDLNPTGVECQQTTAPADSNLVTNGTFAGGESAWYFYGDATHSVSSGALNLTRNLNGALPSTVYQNLNVPVNANSPMEVTLQLGNSSSEPKQAQVFLHNTDWSNIIACTFTIPGNTALSSYSLRGRTSAAWSQPYLNIFVEAADGAPALLIDNINAAYRPSLNPQGTECGSPATPSNTNLVVNGSFNSGISAWGTFGALTHSVSSGVLNMTRNLNAPELATIYQDIYTPAVSNAPFEVSLQLGNSSGVAKQMIVYLHNSNWSDILACTFNVPAGAALDTYVMRGRTAMAWSTMYLNLYVEPADGVAALLVDNVNVQYKPSINPVGTECVPAAGGLGAEGLIVTEATPTPEVSATVEPTTVVPTEVTVIPTTEVATEIPTTEVPTVEPTAEATATLTTEVPTTEAPTAEPTAVPTTEVPTEAPTEAPTDIPVSEAAEAPPDAQAAEGGEVAAEGES